MAKPKPVGTKRIGEVGQRIYDDRLRKKLEPRHTGKIVTIEVDSGDYFVGDTLHEANQKARKKYPDTVFYAVKVGYPAVYSFTSGTSIAGTSS